MRDPRHATRSLFNLLSITLVYSLLASMLGPLAARRVEAASAAAATKASAAANRSRTARDAPRREGELLVRFREGAAEQEKDAAARGARRVGHLRGNSRLERLRLQAGRTLEAAAAELGANPAVELVEPNYLIKPEQSPSDPRFAEQWALGNSGQNGGRAESDIGAQRAWQTVTGSPQTVVAVVDSGVDFTHPDLAGNLWSNTAERPNGRDDDRDGFADDTHGWDWVSDTNAVADGQGHGTSVAGIIAAEGNNATGISGVMWRAGLMSLRVLDNTGTGDVASAVEAIDYAAAHGAQVINLSWGTEGESLALRDAIARAGERNVVVVCSAGNAARNIDGVPYYPASFNLPNMISVAASNNLDQIAPWSNWGVQSVAVAAPGNDILTTAAGGGYRVVSGTSAAAPFVAGIAGLVKALRPAASATEVRAAVNGGVRRVAGLEGVVAAGGVASAPGALAAASGLPAGGGHGGNGNGGNGNGGSGNGGSGSGNNGGGDNGGGNGQGQGGGNVTPPPQSQRGSGGRGHDGGFDVEPPAPTAGGPGENHPDLAAARREDAHKPEAPTFIHADLMPICDVDCGDSSPVGGAGGSDPYFATARVNPGNRTGSNPPTGVVQSGEELGSRNFNWSVPLVGLTGRGGLHLGVGLYYNSLVWSKQGSYIQYNADHGFPGPGFRIGLPALQPVYTSSLGVPAYMMITGSGGHAELLQVGAGTYESADGGRTQLTENGDGTRTVRTSDGSQLHFVYNASINEYRCTRITDRNGNYITINYGAINGDSTLGRPTSVVDTLGRQFDFNYDAQNYLASITQTRGGATHTWATFGYSTQHVQPTFSGLTVIGPTNQSIPVLTAVGLGDGSSFRFEYNGWGMVNRILRVAPDGHTLAYSSYNFPSNATAQTDCPRFTERRDWAENWNGGGEAVTGFSADPNGAWTQVTVPDGTIYKVFFATSGWEKGLPTTTEVWSGGVKRKWTTTAWTQDVTGPTSVAVGDSGFESPYVGYGVYQNTPAGGAWTYTSDAGGAAGLSGHNSALTNGMTVPQGNQVAFLYGGGGGAAAQTLSGFKAGVPYTLTFSAAQRRYSNVGGQMIDVYLDDRLLGSYYPGSYFFSNISVTFTTTPGAHTLKFAGRNAAKCALIDGVGISTPGNTTANPRIAETNDYDDAGNRKRTAFSYHGAEQFNLPHGTTEYAADGATPLRSSYLDYNLGPAYVSRRIIGLVGAVHILDHTTGSYLSKVSYDYDWGGEYLAATPQQATQHAANNTDPTGRGNVSRVLRWDVTDIANGAKTTEVSRTGYNSTGTVAFSRDALGHQSSLSYADSFSDGVNRNTFAYATSVTDGDGFSSSSQYSYDLGAQTRAQDPKGMVVLRQYDAAGRPTTVTNQTSGAYTRWLYPASMGYVQTFSTLTQPGVESYAIEVYDGAGRVRETAADHPGSAGGYTAQKFVFDVMGRLAQRSNPTEITVGWAPTGDDAAGWRWTTQQFDWQGRSTLTTTPAGNTIEASYGGCGCAGGDVVTVRDERGRRRKLYKDVLGRLAKVEELNWDQSVYSTTTYAYNGRDQIAQVNQAGQLRTFGYDGHGRLTSRTTPEQGTTTLSYYADDQVQTVADARGATRTAGYNNRHLTTSVTHGTPAGVAATANLAFGYDAAGNRTSMTDGLGSVSYAYNTLSQLTSETRSFTGVGSFSLSYTYNVGGALTGVTNQWGAQVSYQYDTAGRASAVGGANYAGVSTYAQGMLYRAFGGLKAMSYGNGKALSALYDDRMRMTKWDVAGVLGYNYSYGTFSENSGRVTFAQSLYDATLDRSYDYDHVGRLMNSYTGINARAHVGAPGGRWDVSDGPYAQDYQYDVFGNVTRRNGWGTTNPYFTASYANNRRVGHGYDAAGNLTDDGVQTYQYDANGKQTYASSTALTQGYDGDGLRSKKTENGVTTFYLRSTVLGGRVAAEINGGGGWTRGYVYGGAQLLAIQYAGAVSWVHQDPVVKSQRITSAAGAVTAGVELDPWGAETSRSFNSAFQPKRFTTYERDANSGDEAMYRRYEGRWMRFAQPDPYENSYDMTDPQTMNRYAYVKNDPVNLVDPSGLYAACVHEAMTNFLAKLAGYDDATAAKLGQFAGDKKGGADSGKFSATSIKNALLGFIGRGPSANIHFASEKKLQKELGKFGSYMASKNFQKAAFALHSLQDVHGPHADYSLPFGHFFAGHEPDYIINDAKFHRVANETFQVLTGKNATLTAGQMDDLIEAVVAGCGEEAKKLIFVEYVPIFSAGGGGGGGDFAGGYLGGGGLPSWYYSMWAFADWVGSIGGPDGYVTVGDFVPDRIEVVTVTVLDE